MPENARRIALAIGVLSLASALPFAVAACVSTRDTVEISEGGTSGGLDAPSGETTSCKSPITQTAKRIGGYVVLMVDASGSMLSDGKYGSATGGVIEALRAVENRKDQFFAISVYSFAGQTHPDPPFKPVPPVFVDSTATSFFGAQLTGDTPTGASNVSPALFGAQNTLITYSPPATVTAGGTLNVVLLVDNLLSSDVASAVGSAELAANRKTPIRTFVVGLPIVASDYSDLAEIAGAGDTAKGGCNIHSVTPPLCFEGPPSTSPRTASDIAASLTRVFEEIACRVEVEGVNYATDAGVFDAGPDAAFVYPPADDSGPKGLTLTWKNNGAEETVPYDATNGWTYGLRGRIQLHGKACTDVVTRTSLVATTCQQ